MTKRSSSVAALTCILAVTAAGMFAGGALRARATVGIGYIPIDSRVFVSRKVMAAWVSTHNEAAINMHAVTLWNGLTAPAGRVFRGVPLAVYDTWYSRCQVYPASRPSTCSLQSIHYPAALDLEPAEQFFHTTAVTGSDILTAVRFNQEMKAFVDTGYKGLPYTNATGLIKAIGDGLTNLEDTSAPTSMMLKPAYDLFSRTEPTVIGYWSGPGLRVGTGASTSPQVPGSTTWLRIAVIDPTGRATNTVSRKFCADTVDVAGNVVSSRTYVAPPRSYRVIPLSQFYAIPVTQQEIAAISIARFDRPRAASVKACPAPIPPNPVAALVGMHVVTAEQKDTWTWQTFWWNPTARPLPGARQGFQYFDFATAYWTVDKPPYGWRYAFNPYLEGNFGTATFGTTYWPLQGKPGSAINLGITTNCISCHSQAVYAINEKIFKTNIYVAHDSQPQLTLAKSILTRNLWSLADRAPHP